MLNKDSYRHKGLRRQLVRTLQSKGINDQNVLAAMERVPRHLFLNSAFEEWAYRDVAFPIESDQTISQPMTVAIQSTLLSVKKGDKILEIGTGSGYQACVLSEMGARVFSLERHQRLYQETTAKLKNMGYSGIRTYLKDGFEGLPRHAPYDKIIVTCAAPYIPDELLAQLSAPGRLVVPVGEGAEQVMKVIYKDAEGKMTTKDHGEFRFVPFLAGISRLSK